MGLVGGRVSKEFPPHGVFQGTVVSYDTAMCYYCVQYEDGDSEELTLAELR